MNSLRPIVRSSVTCSVLSAEALRRVCQQTASLSRLFGLSGWPERRTNQMNQREQTDQTDQTDLKDLKDLSSSQDGCGSVGSVTSDWACIAMSSVSGVVRPTSRRMATSMSLRTFTPERARAMIQSTVMMSGMAAPMT